MPPNPEGNQRRREALHNWPWLGAVFVVVAVVFAAWMVSIANARDLTALEVTLFQILVLVSGISGSYVFGKQSARESAQEIVRPHARSAFRRVVSLYDALGRFAESVEERRTVLRGISENQGGSIPFEHVEAALDLLETQALEQIGTADDAMEDWRDLVPEDVEEIERKVERRARKVESR